jgi:hypothetical protein
MENAWGQARPYGFVFQGGAFQAGGFGFSPGAAAVARSAARWEMGYLRVELGYSGFFGISNLMISGTAYSPLGANDTNQTETGAGLGGKSNVATWGPDASMDFGGLHARFELARQSLASLTRGGASFTLWCDLPGWEKRLPSFYTKDEQAWSNFGDGLHRIDGLLRAETVGFYSPLPLGASLKLESLLLFSDDSPGAFPSDQIYQSQLQMEF